MNITPPRRRWFQFSLATMFVVVTILAVPIGWAAYQLNWIRQRHDVLGRAQTNSESGAEISALIPGSTPMPNPQAPGYLWLFGEEGQFSLTFTFTSEEGYFPSGLSDDEELLIERAKKLFPESQIAWKHRGNRTIYQRPAK